MNQIRTIHIVLAGFAIFVFAGFLANPAPTHAAYSEEQNVVASDGSANDFLGESVGITSDGSLIVVGSEGDDDKGSSAGAAYVLRRSGTTWTEEQKITAPDGVANDIFGFAVAISADGSRIVVGAYADDDNGSGSGGAYVFYKPTSTWIMEQKLTPSDGTTFDSFGESVAISDDGSRIVISSTGDDDNGSGSGSAYVFYKATSTWAQEQKLTASDGAAGDEFSNAVDISSDGSRIVVGSHSDDVSGKSDQGSAYIFYRATSTWAQEQKLTASDGVVSDALTETDGHLGNGARIAADGLTVILGASHASSSFRGAAYIFTRSGVTWSQQQKLTASDAADFDQFGAGLGISSDGSRVVVGAYSDDVGLNSDQGSAYVFYRATSTWTQSEHLAWSTGGASNGFGLGLDMTGNGSRIAIGTTEAVGLNNYQGAVDIFFDAALAPPVLTVVASGTGSGVITDSLAGIDCGIDCTETYTSGATSTLTATPSASSTFVGWSGDADCTDGSVTLSVDVSCIATFALKTYTLTLNLSGNGSGSVTSTASGLGLTYPNSTTATSGAINYGANVAVTAIATSGQNSIMDTDCSAAGGTLQKTGTETSVCSITNVVADKTIGLSFQIIPVVGAGGTVVTSGGGSSGGGAPSYTPPTTGGQSSSSNTSTPVVPSETYDSPSDFAPRGCPLYLGVYIKRGGANDIASVQRLQMFLNEELGINLAMNGVYDDATYAATIRFQEKYASDVLAPWNLTQGTGYVYLTTARKLNYLHCIHSAPGNFVPPIVSSSVFNRNLQLGSVGADVTALQEWLIAQKKGSAAAALQAHGTTKLFGALTKAALMELQSAVGISPASGYFGALTRAYAAAH